MVSLDPRPHRANAERFAVWRLAKSVNWDCSCKEIGKELYMCPKRVKEIALFYAYPIRFTENRTSSFNPTGPPAVDKIMRQHL